MSNADHKVVNKAKFLMKYGSPSHQEKVLKKRIKATAVVRWNAAINGPKHHLDILVHDKDPEVRAAVAVQGHKEHLDKLVNDKDAGVRMKVASYGDESHHDKLVNDPDETVRSQVVHYTKNMAHVGKLINDPVESISRKAIKRSEQWRKGLSESIVDRVRKLK